MEILHLRYFLTLAKYQHMTRAAKSLHIAQPALSQIIKHLENELGTTLFDRKGRNIILNDSGKLLEEKAESIICAIDALPTQLLNAENEVNHTIHLNLMAASSIITQCIIEFKKKHPDIKFILHQNSEQEYDLSITASDSCEKTTTDTILFTEDFYLAVPAASPLSSKSIISLKDTVSEDFISLGSSKPIRSICDHFCQEAGFLPHIIFESEDPQSVRNLIAAGIGIGFWPSFSWGILPTDEVKLIPISDPVCKRDVIVTFADHNRKAAVQDFYTFLKDHF